MNKQQQRILALAGIAQAVALVRDLAQHGDCNSADFNHCLETLFTLQTENIEQIYGNADNFHYGMKTLKKIFGHQKNPLSKDIIHYFLSVLHLERRLYKAPALLESLQLHIEKAEKQSEFFNSHQHQNIIASLADAYLQTFGRLNFRIMVQGDNQYLQQDDILAKIRVLLLAAIRSAVLWRQLGGNRWQLIFARKKLLSSLD